MEFGSAKIAAQQPSAEPVNQRYLMSSWRKLPVPFRILPQHPVFGIAATPAAAVGTVSRAPFYAFSIVRCFCSSITPAPSEPTGGLPPPPGFVVEPPAINPPDPVNPDPATLREHWKYAIRLFSTWYSHAWGMTVLSGLTFFALGWGLKGENPLRTTLAEKRKESELKRMEEPKQLRRIEH